VQKTKAAVPVMLVLLAFSALVAADETKPETKSATQQQIVVDLRARQIQGTLPFDIAFDLTGDIPDVVDRVVVHYAECHRGTCPTAGLDPQGCGVTFDDPNAWTPKPDEPELSWVRNPVIDQKQSDKSVPFVIGMPMLDAQKEYRFVFELFSRPSAEELQQFHATVTNAVDKGLKPFTNREHSLDLTSVDVEHIQQSVVAALKEVAPCAKLSGAVSETPTRQQTTKFLRQFRDIATATKRVSDAPKRLEEHGQRLVHLLDRLRAESVRKSMAPLGADNASKRNKELRESLLNLQSLSDLQIGAIGRGSDPDNPDPKISQYEKITTQADFTARAGALGKLGLLTSSAAEALRRIEQTRGSKAPEHIAETQQLLDDISNEANAMVGLAQNAGANLGASELAIGALSSTVSQIVNSIVIVNGGSIADFKTNNSWYVSLDAGLVWGSQIEKVVPYAGANIYFRPVNRDTPLRQRDSFGRRFSMTIGLTVSSIADDNKATRDDLFGNQSLLFGAGYRLTDAVRISGGALIFERQDPNPLISHKRLGTVPYIAMSFDVDVAKSFLGKIFPNQ